MTAAVTESIRTGIGVSEVNDAWAAGHDAAEEAMTELSGGVPALVIVYASVRYQLAELLAGVRTVTGDTPLVGASSNGHFHHGTVTPRGRGVTVLVLTAGPYEFGVSSVEGLSVDAYEAGRVLARTAQAAAGPTAYEHAALILLADGLAGHQQDLLNGIHKVTGAAVPVVGGCAGDDGQLLQTFVFDADRAVTDAAVAVWVSSPHPLPVVADHGWKPNGLPLLVTKVDGPIIHEIGDKPAIEVFQCSRGRHQASPDDPPCRCPCCATGWNIDESEEGNGQSRRQGYHHAHALGLIEPDGTQLIRGTFLGDDNLLHTFCPLPTYAAVQVVSSRPEDMLEIVDGVVERAIGGREATLLLGFSCEARADIMGDHGMKEAAKLQDAAGNATTFGIYTYGEFARSNSIAGFHNATVAAIAL